MAKAEVVVTFSSQDRQLLRDIRDALRALGVEPEDEDSTVGAVQRLVEQVEWYHSPLDDRIVADTKGYTWNGQGWVPKA